MKRRKFTAGMIAAGGLWGLGPAAWLPAQAAASGLDRLSDGDVTLGLRTALERGAVAAVGLLGRSGGFLDNPRVRIPLPSFLNDAARVLKFTGQQQRVDELVTAMNRAAEAAVPQAKGLLLGAVRSMNVADGRRILTGGDNAVTTFFAEKTRAPLTAEFLPIVTRATEKVALADRYNAVAGKASSFGLVGKDDANLQRHVTSRALDGLFLMIGEEERKIRRDPIGTGSSILGKVFGAMR